MVRALVSRQRDAGNRVSIYEFPASLQAPHEYVDPEDPNNKVPETYPALVDVLTSGTTSRLTPT
jgi:hypothetical protein